MLQDSKSTKNCAIPSVSIYFRKKSSDSIAVVNVIAGKSIIKCENYEEPIKTRALPYRAHSLCRSAAAARRPHRRWKTPVARRRHRLVNLPFC